MIKGYNLDNYSQSNHGICIKCKYGLWNKKNKKNVKKSIFAANTTLKSTVIKNKTFDKNNDTINNKNNDRNNNKNGVQNGVQKTVNVITDFNVPGQVFTLSPSEGGLEWLVIYICLFVFIVFC